tara:strand:+ start:848 stop:1387 length:540 start_codon:yes stop_codon:yes gene_type:complete
MSQLKVNSIVPAGGLPSGATGGGIIQIVQTKKSDTASNSTSSGGAWDVSSIFSVSITPSLNSSVILLLGTINTASSTTMPNFMSITRNGSIATNMVGDADGSRIRASAGGYYGHLGGIETQHFSFIDTPASTSQQTYSLQLRHDSGSSKTLYLNRSNGDSNSDQVGRFISSLTAMEIGV